MIKKFFLLISIFFMFLSSSFSAKPNYGKTIEDYGKELYGSGHYVVVTVSEPLPGMNCIPDPVKQESCTGATNGPTNGIANLVCPPGTAFYCVQPRGSKAFYLVAKAIIKYLTYLVIIIAVLALVVYGIVLSASGLNPNFKSVVKSSLLKAFIGILLLFLGGFLLYLINPAIYKTIL